jgi:Zn-dependent peptidase ImmA (M78 family)
LPNLKPTFGELSHDEIAEALLDEAGALDILPTCESDLLNYLGLRQMSFDFGDEPDFIQVAPDIASKLRAALSVNHRVVATHTQLGAKRSRWGVLHEIAHFVLPEHMEKLFLDDDRTLSVWTHNRLEKEANSLAAELVFQGNRFTEESLDLPLSCKTAIELAPRYDASFESAIRRYVERHAQPCAAIVYEKAQTIPGEDMEDEKYRIHYTVTSLPFSRKYFSGVQTDPEFVRGSEILNGALQIGSVVPTELSLKKQDGDSWIFRSELFTNGYKIFQFVIGDIK